MGHSCNYSGHPLGAIAGLANLEILEVESLTENAATPARISSSNFTRRLIIIRSWEKSAWRGFDWRNGVCGLENKKTKF